MTPGGIDGIEDYYPLSPMQEGMLFHTLYAPDSGVYVTQVSFTLGGPLDRELFAESWRWLLRRHAILRTSFAWEGLETPVQLVEAEVGLPLAYEDWSAAGGERGGIEDRLRRFLHEDRQRGFDLTAAPLLRLGLLRLGEAEHRVVWSFHHLLLDGWSVTVVLREVGEIYEALRQGREPRLEPARPYRDFILWLDRQDLQAAEAYWREALRGVTAPTLLPLEAPPEAASRESGPVRASLAPAATDALLAFSRRHGLTLNTVLQGVWALLLARCSGNPDVVFGAAVSGRQADLAGIESMVGLFMNTLLVRARVEEGATAASWLRGLQASWARAREFEHSPLIQVQGWSEIPRGMPLFESVLSVGSYPADRSRKAFRQEPAMAPGSARNAPLREVSTTDQTNVPLNLEVVPGAETLLELRFDARRFSRPTMERSAGHLRTLLEALPTAAERRLEDLPWLTEEERRQLLAVAAGPVSAVAAMAEGGFAHTLVEGWARRTPEAVAAEWEGGSLSYGELDGRANRLASELVRRGVGTDSLVALLGLRGPDVLAAILAVWKAGGAYLPADVRQPASRLAHVLGQSGARWALVAREVRPLLDAAAALLPEGDHLQALPLEGWEEAGEPAPALRCAPQSRAYVIYTSGSTGLPKGVMVEHRGMLNHLQAKIRDLGLGPGDAVAQTAALTFDISVWQLLAPLLVGGRVRIVGDAVAADPQRLLAEVDRHRITILETVPSLLQAALDVLEPGRRPRLADLRWHLVTGEELPAEPCRRWLRLYPAVPLLNAYGPTECSDDVTHQAVSSPPPPGAGSVPIGSPLDNLRLHVLDPALRLVPVGVPGELFVAGVGVGRGYLGDPVRTAEAFVPNPFGTAPGERLYRTGDRVRRLERGELRFLGRIGRQLKIRGFRIEPGEIEAALLSHPGVAGAVVLAREGRGGDRRLIAYAVPDRASRPGAGELREALRGWLEARLPEYMVPSAVVLLEAFPVNAHGKVDLKALPAPPEERGEDGEGYLAPRDETERVLVEIWEEVLGARPIGVRDNFFRLGGHSLLAVRVMGLVSRRLERDLPLATLVEGGTVELLARALNGGEAPPGWSPLVRIQPEGERLPFFCLHPIGGQVLCYADLARCLGSRQPFYGLQAVRLDEVGETAPSIEEMAAEHLAAVRAVQPEGPYLLGGWSMGGLLAFEMARQLLEQGDEAALVAILDAWSPAIHRVVPDDAYLLYEIVKDQALQKGSEPPFSDAELRALGPDERLRVVLEQGKRAGLAAADADAAWLRRFLLGYRARRLALQRYQPAAYPGRLTLIRARQSDPELLSALRSEVGIDVDDPALGWSAYSALPVDVRFVEGNHSTMCLEPQVRSLAECLRSLFEEAVPRALNGAAPGASQAALPRPALAAGPGSESR